MRARWLGVNGGTIPRLRCEIVVGAANNQLAEPADADRLAARGILYVPDYVANAGGVIDGARDICGWTARARAGRRRSDLRHVRDILERAAAEGHDTGGRRRSAGRGGAP